MKKLHITQIQLLKLLKDNIADPLTIRELGSAINEDSPGVIFHHIGQLEKKGYLKRNPNNPRDYIILEGKEARIVYINKYGSAKCGPNGFLLDNNIIDTIPIASSLLKFPAVDAFIVEANGDSMEPKIYNRDIIIGMRHSVPSNGDLIVCAYREEVIIKKFYKAAEQVMLLSLNEKYESINVGLEELHIAGIVKNIIHYPKQ